jgi:hypothetical protein
MLNRHCTREEVREALDAVFSPCIRLARRRSGTKGRRKWVGRTPADTTLLVNMLGRPSFREEEYDAVLAQLSGLGCSLETTEEGYRDGETA